jgi:hypothetical protein
LETFIVAPQFQTNTLLVEPIQEPNGVNSLLLKPKEKMKPWKEKFEHKFMFFNYESKAFLKSWQVSAFEVIDWF